MPTIAADTGIKALPIPLISLPIFCRYRPCLSAILAVVAICELIPDNTDVTPSCNRITKSITSLIFYSPPLCP